MPQSKVSGLTEVRANLKKAKSTLGRPMLRAQARAAARVVRDQARQNAPVRTGYGRKNVIHEERKSSDPTQAVFSVGPRIRPYARSAFYLRFAETGTKGHKVSVLRTRGRKVKVQFQTKQILRARDTGKFLGHTVEHPGQRARPWLKPALAQAQDRALQAALTIGKQRLEKR